MPRNPKDYSDRDRDADYNPEDPEQSPFNPAMERDEWRSKWFDKEFTDELKDLSYQHGMAYQAQHSVLDITREDRLNYLADTVTAFNNVDYANRDERWQGAMEVANQTYQPIFQDLSKDEEKQLFANDRTLRYLLSTDKYRGYRNISYIDKGVDEDGNPVRDYRIEFKDAKLAQDLATDYGGAAYYTPTDNMESQQMRYAQALFNSQEWDPASQDPQALDKARETQAAFNMNDILEESRIHHNAEPQERYILIHGTVDNVRWDDPLAAENTLRDRLTHADDVTTQMQYYDHPDHDAYRIAMAAKFAIHKDQILEAYDTHSQQAYTQALQEAQDDSQAFAKASLSGAGHIQAEDYPGPPDFYKVDAIKDITDQMEQHLQILDEHSAATGTMSPQHEDTILRLLQDTSQIEQEALALQGIQEITEQLRRAGDNLRAVNFMLQPVDESIQNNTQDMDLQEMLRGHHLETIGYQLRQPQMPRSYPAPSQPLVPSTP